MIITVKRLILYFIRYKNRIIKKSRVSNNDIFLIDNNFGHYRGTPIDRVLIENELKRFSSECRRNDKTLKILEFGTNTYSKKFFAGYKSTIFYYSRDKRRENSQVIYGDLMDLNLKVRNKFNIIIATQFLSFLKDPKLGLARLIEMIEEDGILFGTEPFLMPISAYDQKNWGEYVRFTSNGFQEILKEFVNIEYRIKCVGNPTSAVLNILGYSYEEVQEYINLNLHSDTHHNLIQYEIKKLSY